MWTMVNICVSREAYCQKCLTIYIEWSRSKLLIFTSSLLDYDKKGKKMEMITSQLQGKLWLYDEVRNTTVVCLASSNRYAEWCDISPSSEASSQESNKPRPRDYTFRELTLIKVGHTDISEPVKKALLKLWLIDYFQDNSACENNPTHRNFDDYKWEFNLEIDKLADEYELGIRKKGHILDHIWEYCNQVHNKNYEFENEECEEIRIEDKDYHPPEVQVETFEVKKYSFKGGQSFICVTKDLDNTLPLGRKNGSKIQKLGGNYRDRLDSYSFGNFAEIAAVTA
ncbi:hypothetical protein Tco_1365990 [Tanacetum coccineum]